MQPSQNNNNVSNITSPKKNLYFIENEKPQLKIQHDLSRGIGVIPSEHSEPAHEPIPTAIEDSSPYLMHHSSKSNDDYTSGSVPPYDIGYDSIEDDNNIEEDEGPLEALKRQEDAKRTPLQNKIYYFLEAPTSKWARAYSWLSLTVNLTSISILCVDSIPSIMGHEFYDRIWYVSLNQFRNPIIRCSVIDFFGNL
ncbi:1707_t:CDS:2, partial [Cetraspora pellucida]